MSLHKDQTKRKRMSTKAIWMLKDQNSFSAGTCKLITCPVRRGWFTDEVIDEWTPVPN